MIIDKSCGQIFGVEDCVRLSAQPRKYVVRYAAVERAASGRRNERGKSPELSFAFVSVCRQSSASELWLGRKSTLNSILPHWTFMYVASRTHFCKKGRAFRRGLCSTKN